MIFIGKDDKKIDKIDPNELGEVSGGNAISEIWLKIKGKIKSLKPKPKNQPVMRSLYAVERNIEEELKNFEKAKNETNTIGQNK